MFACLVAFTIWVIAWVLPVTFMLALAWGCDSNARQLGRRALVFLEATPIRPKLRSTPPSTPRGPATTGARSCAPRSSSSP